MRRTHRSYRDVLNLELKSRIQKNPMYSLRAFARDVGISPARLSSVLSGRYGLSRSSAVDMARKLGLSHEEALKFCDLVESEHGRSPQVRNVAQRRLRDRGVPIYHDVEDVQFRPISEWYYFAILELSKMKSFKPEASWVAKRLNIKTDQAHQALDDLIRIGALVQDPRKGWHAQDRYFANLKSVPSEAVRKYHKHILGKAAEALDSQPVEKREFFSMSMGVSHSDLPAIQEKIRVFRDELAMEFITEGKKDSLYQLSLQFFSLESHDA